ncbi:MAG: hypothetical protein ACP5HU_12910 [Phycisphaerae bacterium]
MQITRMDFEGKPGRYATCQRRQRTDGLPAMIDVTILTPQQPDGRVHHVQADCEEDLRSMAECLQRHLDGCPGTNSDVYGYYAELLRLSDL